jgi:hypothetical protein
VSNGSAKKNTIENSKELKRFALACFDIERSLSKKCTRGVVVITRLSSGVDGPIGS